MALVQYYRPFRSTRSRALWANRSAPGAFVPTVLNTSIDNWDDKDLGPNVQGWRQRIARGESATTTLSGTRAYWIIEPGLINTCVYDPIYPVGLQYVELFYSGEFVGTSVPSEPAFLSETKANNEALSSLVRRARSIQTQFMGGVFLGELSEALKMIRHPAAALRRGLDDYLGSVKERTRRLKNNPRRKVAADTWLEYSFGWSPLIRDIEDGRKAIKDLRKRQPQLVRVEGSYVDQTSSSPIQVIDSSGATFWGWNAYGVGSVIVKYYGAVYARMGRPSSDSLRAVGFSWNNFIPTAWELIPYSFLVDYFTNIGEILSAGSFSTSNFAWLNKTVIKETRTYRISNYLRTAPPSSPAGKVVTFVHRPCKTVAVKRRVSRAPYSGSLIPTLEFQIPGIGSLKWLNLAALGARHRSLTPLW